MFGVGVGAASGLQARACKSPRTEFRAVAVNYVKCCRYSSKCDVEQPEKGCVWQCSSSSRVLAGRAVQGVSDFFGVESPQLQLDSIEPPRVRHRHQSKNKKVWTGLRLFLRACVQQRHDPVQHHQHPTPQQLRVLSSFVNLSSTYCQSQLCAVLDSSTHPCGSCKRTLHHRSSSGVHAAAAMGRRHAAAAAASCKRTC